MPNIKALEFANYVKQQKDILQQTLLDKHLNVSDNKALSYYIAATSLLPNYEATSYIEDPLFVQLREDYESDPLLSRNGGEYDYCEYDIINNYYDTSLIQSRANVHKVITSDGQEFTATGSGNLAKLPDTTITWDNTKNLTLADGTKCRWLKMYFKSTNYSVYFTTPTSKVPDDKLFILFDKYTYWNTGGSSSGYGMLTDYVNVQEVVLGYNVNQILSVSGITYAYRKVYTYYYHTTLSTTGLSANSCNILNIDDLSISINGVINFSTNTADVSKVLLTIYAMLSTSTITNITVSNCYIPELNLSGYTKSGEFKINGQCNSIVKLICPQNVLMTFNSDPSDTNYLTTVRRIVFPNIISSNIVLKNDILDKASYLDMFNKLENKTGSSTGTIILSKNRQAIFTTEDLAIATSKNWTISFS